LAFTASGALSRLYGAIINRALADLRVPCFTIHESSADVAGVLSHHEAWGGLGYPQGLRSEAIPLDAQIIAVADAFDAMISDRPYRRGRDPEHACAVLWAGRGVQWQAELVETFVELVRPKLQLVAA
jgi:HD-GYP domain-containing protein (c-di-GMP phosphodiesterase class II)